MPEQNQQDQFKPVTVTYREHKYPLDGLLAQAHTGPMIEVNMADASLSNEFLLTTSQNQDIAAINTRVNALDLIFYKHEGKYVVVFGRDQFVQAQTQHRKKLKGRLLTSVAMKKVRILPDLPPPPPVVAAPSWPPARPYTSSPSRTRR